VILTVTLNAAVDRTVAVPNFHLGHRHRAVETRTMAGGKGVNIARALRLLGRPVIATGLAGGATGTRLLDELREESVLTAFTRIAGESRTNLAVIDPTTGEQTEINERGPELGEDDIERFTERLLYLARGARICVLAGSVPPGAPEDAYAGLIAKLREFGVLTVLDTDGEQMRAGLRAEPAVVAPNVEEAEEAVGHEFNDLDDYGLGLAGLLEMGAGEAIITSESGCVAIVGEGAERRRYEARIEQLEPVTTVGSGDCFLAGYVAARYEGASPRECLIFGVACGAESTQHFGAGTLDRREVERLLPSVEISDLSAPAEVA
jgi:1-phosphofructokinase/tagatose 6-phosphate kinase